MCCFLSRCGVTLVNNPAPLELRKKNKALNVDISDVIFHSLSEADGLSWKSGTNSALSL